MREIKAYIQRDRVKQVVEALQREHAPGISIVEIHPVGYGYEPNYFAEQFEDPFKRYGYLKIVSCAQRYERSLLNAMINLVPDRDRYRNRFGYAENSAHRSPLGVRRICG